MEAQTTSIDKGLDTKDFNSSFYTYEFTVNDFEKARVSKIIEMIGSNKMVLDVGCMDGAIGALIKKQNNIVYGIDLSESAVSKALNKGIKAKVGDAEKFIDFSANYFDVITASEIIEHVYDTDKFLCEIHRVLKPDGYLILTTPNIATLSRRFKFLRGKDPGLEYSVRHPNSVGHIRFFLKSTITDLLERNNFKVIRFRSDMFQFAGIMSSKLGDWWPSLGKRFVIQARKHISVTSRAKNFMERELIEKFCTLLTSDTNACSELFSESARYITVNKEGKLVNLSGKDNIKKFLSKANRDMIFKVTSFEKLDDKYIAGINISSNKFKEVNQKINFSISEEKFDLFEVLH